MPSQGAKFLPRTQIPNGNRVITTTHECLPIWADGDGMNPPVQIHSEGTKFYARTQLPNLNRVVITATHKMHNSITTRKNLPIGADGEGINRASPSQGAKFLPRTQIPNSNRLVITATDKNLPIWANGDGINRFRMPS